MACPLDDATRVVRLACLLATSLPPPASGRSDLASWFMHMVPRIQNTDFLNDGWFLAVASEVYNEIVLVLCAATLFGVLRNIRGFEIM